MRIDEYVQQLPFSALLQMAEAHEGELLIEPKESLSERFTAHLLEHAEMECCYTRMSREEQELLRFFLLAADDEYVSQHQLRSDGRLTPEEIKAGLVLLRRKGLLYSARRFWGEEVFALPSDLFEAWLGFFVQRLGGDGERESIPEDEVGEIQVHPPVFVDVLHFLAFLQKNETLLTQKGHLYKRYAQRLAERLYFLQQEAPFAASFVPLGEEAGPPSLLLLLDLTQRLGLVKFGEGRALVDPVTLQAWIGFSPHEASDQIYRAWRRYYAGEKRFLLPCLAVMEAFPAFEWHTWDEVMQRWEKLYRRPPSAEVLNTLQGVCLSWLNVWGYVEVGKWQGKTVWRWGDFSLRRGKTVLEEKFLLQPDFEVLVSPYLCLEKHWRLCLFSEVKKRDRVNIHRIDQENLSQALEIGCDLSRILPFLEENSLAGVPDNVRSSLAQWGEQYGRIRLVDCVVMDCQDPGLAHELGGHPEISRFVIERLNEKQFIVSRRHASELLKWLERKGYEPRKKILYPEVAPAAEGTQEEGTEEDAPFTPREWPEQKGMWLLKGEHTTYLLNKNLPSALAAGGNVSSSGGRSVPAFVPPSWSRELRRYHVTTVKDILKLCVKLRKNVRVERMDAKSGRTLEVVLLPQDLQLEAEREEVVGRMGEAGELCVLPLAEIQRIQVLT